MFSFSDDPNKSTYQLEGLTAIDYETVSTEVLSICKKKTSSFCKDNQIIFNGVCFCLNGLTINQDGFCIENCHDGEEFVGSQCVPKCSDNR